MGEARSKAETSTPTYVDYTYRTALIKAVINVIDAIQAVMPNVDNVWRLRGAVQALWFTVPPPVRRAVAEKLRIKGPDSLAVRAEEAYVKKEWPKLVRKYGEKRLRYCSKFEGIAVRVKGGWWVPFQYQAEFRDCYSAFDALHKYETGRLSQRAWAYIKVYEAIIDELYRQGWLAREDLTMMGRER